MKYPNFAEEKKIFKQGYKTVTGIDEAGRGPLAGPVVAACVNFQLSAFNFQSIFKNINDSKKLTSKAREEIYEKITKHSGVHWGVGVVSEKVIDKINILQATKLAMARAVLTMQTKSSPCKADFLLIDGNFKLDSFYLPSSCQKSIIKGDQKVFSIAAASIIAKATRDRMMDKYHKKYPQYGFASHKGYGTAFHINMLKKYGPCKIHRKTFYPVSAC